MMFLYMKQYYIAIVILSTIFGCLNVEGAELNYEEEGIKHFHRGRFEKARSFLTRARADKSWIYRVATAHTSLNMEAYINPDNFTGGKKAEKYKIFKDNLEAFREVNEDERSQEVYKVLLSRCAMVGIGEEKDEEKAFNLLPHAEADLYAQYTRGLYYEGKFSEHCKNLAKALSTYKSIQDKFEVAKEGYKRIFQTLAAHGTDSTGSYNRHKKGIKEEKGEDI